MSKGMHAGYEGLQRKKLFALLVTLALLLAVAVISAGTGSIRLTPGEIFSTLFGGGDARSHTVLFEIRLPRIAAGVLVGAALGMSGAVMQCVLNNPLASASTLGVSQGAAFGAAVGIIVFGGGVTATGGAYAVQKMCIRDSPSIIQLLLAERFLRIFFWSWLSITSSSSVKPL